MTCHYGGWHAVPQADCRRRDFPGTINLID